mgnify:CR=1 FL=1
MDASLQHELLKCETDIVGTLERLCGDEALYLSCLKMFPGDETMLQLKDSLREERWDDAFTAAHALKGLAANMGFIPLFHASAEMVLLIRAGRTSEIERCYDELKQCYDGIIEVIRAHCGDVLKGEEA